MNKPRVRVVAEAECDAEPAGITATKPAAKAKPTASAKPAAKSRAKTAPKTSTTPKAKAAPKASAIPKAKVASKASSTPKARPAKARSAPKAKPEPADRIDEPAAEPGMVALPEEFTQPALKALYECVSAQRDSGLFRGLNGGKVKRTDGAGVQFLLACFASPVIPGSDASRTETGADTSTGADSDTSADTSLTSAPVLIANEKLLGAIAALGARHLLDSCLVEAAAADTDIIGQKLAA